MQSTGRNLPNALIWITGSAVTLLCAAGIAAIMGWIPVSTGKSGEARETGKPRSPSANSGSQSGQGLRAAPPRSPAELSQGLPPSVRARCGDCGVIESVRTVEVGGEGTGLGAVGGAVVGGILGNQVGSGRGRELATVAGAVGGVVAGNEIEKRTRSTAAREVTVRLDDGTARVIREAGTQARRAGDHVKVVDGVITAN